MKVKLWVAREGDHYMLSVKKPKLYDGPKKLGVVMYDKDQVWAWKHELDKLGITIRMRNMSIGRLVLDSRVKLLTSPRT